MVKYRPISIIQYESWAFNLHASYNSNKSLLRSDVELLQTLERLGALDFVLLVLVNDPLDLGRTPAATLLQTADDGRHSEHFSQRLVVETTLTVDQIQHLLRREASAQSTHRPHCILVNLKG